MKPIKALSPMWLASILGVLVSAGLLGLGILNVTAEDTPPANCPPTGPAQCHDPETTNRQQAWPLVLM